MSGSGDVRERRLKSEDMNKSETISESVRWNTDSKQSPVDSTMQEGSHPLRSNVRFLGWTFNKVILITHVNIFLYSTCYWIQTGTLPVSKCLAHIQIVCSTFSLVCFSEYVLRVIWRHRPPPLGWIWTFFQIRKLPNSSIRTNACSF